MRTPPRVFSLLFPILWIIRPTPAPAAPPASESSPEVRGQQIIIPKVEWRETALREALGFLQQKGRATDPAQRGVNIVLLPAAFEPPTVTLAVQDVPFTDVLRSAAGQTNLEVRYRPTAIVLAPPGSTDPAPLTQGVGAKANSILLPKVEFRDASLREGVEFFRRKALSLDPQNEGVKILLQDGEASETKVSILLTDIPLGEALQYFAEQAGYEVVADADALTVRPRK